MNKMNDKIYFKNVLSESSNTGGEQMELFALLNLGILESLSNGLISASDAVRTFFHAENCLFVQQHMRNQTAEEIMSRGVQLPDLFEILSPNEAQREFQRELAKIRSLCLTLLEQNFVPA